MNSRYLLPCPCGRKIVVQPRQAGQAVECHCGASLEVPTMLEMAKLEEAPAESGPPPPRTVWGTRQRLILVGAMLVMWAAVATIYLRSTRPTAPIPPSPVTPEEIRQRTAGFSPLQTYEAWQLARAAGLDTGRPSQDLQYLHQLAAYDNALWTYHAWTGVIVVIAASGIGLIVGALVKRRGRHFFRST